jgi:hypothetical protein
MFTNPYGAFTRYHAQTLATEEDVTQEVFELLLELGDENRILLENAYSIILEG